MRRILFLAALLLAVSDRVCAQQQAPVQPSPPPAPAATNPAPIQVVTTPPAPDGAPRRAELVAPPPTVSAADAARYLAGMPVTETSPLVPLTRDRRWVAHANAMNAAFATLEQRQLANIRAWRTELLAPALQISRVCLYLFSGPDFLYANAFYPECDTYLLQGLEAADPLPDFVTLPPAALLGALPDVEAALNTLLNFSFFKTKDMRTDLQRGALKGVLPILFVFLARAGGEITEVNYASVDRNGHLLEGGPAGASRGVKISFVTAGAGARKTLYYFTTDLADDALRRNPGVLRFYESFGPANTFLKAASYLLHEGSFNTARSELLSISATVLQDDSGIPVRYFSPDRWTLRFFGTYAGPIRLFAKFYQADLRQYYATSSPKPLPFGFGYQWNRRNSTLILAVKK